MSQKAYNVELVQIYRRYHKPEIEVRLDTFSETESDVSEIPNSNPDLNDLSYK